MPDSARDSTQASSARRSGDAAAGIATAIGVHAAIAAAILGTAWSVSTTRRQRDTPVVLTADFFSPAPARPHDAAKTDPDRSPSDHAAASKQASNDLPQQELRARELADRLRALEGTGAPSAELDALARRFGIGEPDDRASAASAGAGASFAGLVSGNATKVAYVVDASGSMIGSFPAIVDAVERSIARLEPTQHFTVVCFRRDAAETPDGSSDLRPASRAERARVVAWLRHEVVPSGRSSPVEALARALASGADCVFLLSTTVTGPGRHELDKDSLLELLDRLNPRDPETGRRRTTIQCIQFLENDPGGALEAVAREHFGPGGFRFISRDDAGLDPPRRAE